jgi:hypothetical protein
MPALVRALAETTSRDRAALDHVVNEARKAGVVSPTKRGFGASPVSITDAANLLIATFGTDNVKQIGELVPQYRSLRRWGLDPRTPSHRYRVVAAALGEDVFAALDEATDFGQALEVLLGKAPQFAQVLFACAHMEAAEYGEDQRKNAIEWSMHHFRVAFRRFPAAASIRLEISPEVEWVFRPVPDLRSRGFYTEPQGDDQVERSVGFRTIMHLTANILAPPDDDTTEGGVE